MQLAARPDDKADLRDIARNLQDLPSLWLTSPNDLVNGMRRVARHLDGIADRLEDLPPPARAGRPEPPLPRRKRSTPEQGQLAFEQGQLALC